MKSPFLLLAIVFCNFQNVVNSQACIDSTLIDPSVLCFEIWSPVCGCNGVTYSNDCEATYSAGVVSYTSGECTGSNADCLDLGGVDFGVCDMAMGVAFVNGACQYLSGCGWEVDGQDYQVYSFDSIEECNASCEGNSFAPGGGLSRIYPSISPNPARGVCSIEGIPRGTKWRVVSQTGRTFPVNQGPCANLRLPKGLWIVVFEGGIAQKVIVN